jgi:hypothetical protein
LEHSQFLSLCVPVTFIKNNYFIVLSNNNLFFKHFHLGPLKKGINKISNIVSLSCFVIMQLCVEWQKYQIAKHEKADFSFGIIQKTGIISILVIFVTFSNLLIDFLFPIKTKNPGVNFNNILHAVFFNTKLLFFCSCYMQVCVCNFLEEEYCCKSCL